MNLPEKYRPKTLEDLRGQERVVTILRKKAASPTPEALLFTGATGTGKTSAALAYARELGVEVDKADLGGLFELASGEQTGESVRALFRKLAFVPMNRTGWKVAIVNECDSMSPGAAIVWLDALEKIPGKTVLIFTTNNPNALQQRFLDRCSMLPFNATGDRVKADAERLVADVWAREGGQGRAPSLKDLGVVDRQGYVSFRRALQQLGTALLAGPVSEPATGPASSLLDRVRRGRGEGRSWKSLEVELGIPWQRLMCSLRGADAA